MGRRIAVATLSMVMLTSCLPKLDPIVDATNNAVATLDGAISQITAISGSWQTVLQDTVKKLTADAQSTIRVEVQTLLDNSIAAVQVSLMCTVDFVGRRVVSALEALKAKLLGRAVPVPSPFVCSSAPSSVDFTAWQQNRVPIVTLTGFDLKVPLTVQLVQTNGTITVPNVLAELSPYQATINLGGTGLHLTTTSQRITVSTTTAPVVELTAINVIQPQPKICEEKDLTPLQAGSISFLPQNHTRGDSEFDGNGPRVVAHIDIFPVGSKLNYHISMTASETESDFTTVTGTGTGELSLSPPVPSNLRIISVNGPTSSDATYVDSNHTADQVNPTNGGPVQLFTFMGDTDGDDVGLTRLIEARFRPLSLHVVETQNCVTRTEANTMLKAEKQLSPEMANHLKGILKP